MVLLSAESVIFMIVMYPDDQIEVIAKLPTERRSYDRPKSQPYM